MDAKNAFRWAILPMALAMFVISYAIAERAIPHIFVSSRPIKCGEYLASQAANQKDLDYVNAWIEGYLAGYNTYAEGKRFILVEDVNNILEWVERYCEINTTASVFDTLRIFFIKVGAQKE